MELHGSHSVSGGGSYSLDHGASTTNITPRRKLRDFRGRGQGTGDSHLLWSSGGVSLTGRGFIHTQPTLDSPTKAGKLRYSGSDSLLRVVFLDLHVVAGL